MHINRQIFMSSRRSTVVRLSPTTSISSITYLDHAFTVLFADLMWLAVRNQKYWCIGVTDQDARGKIVNINHMNKFIIKLKEM